MAAGDMTNLAAVKAWLGLPAEAGANDGVLSGLITAASDFVGQYLDRPLVSASYVDVRNGNGLDFMLLREGPITAVAEIAFAGGVAYTTVGDPITGAPGFLFDGRKLSLVGAVFPRGERVVVSYTAGYATVPASVEQAVNELVGEAFRRRDRIGQTSKSLGGQETTAYSALDMNATIKAMLAPFVAIAPV